MKPILSLSLAFSSLIVSSTSSLHAQLGDNNPTGVSGQFNGNVTTGVSYDPYTANASRSITDLVVPGSVGAYPLAFTRTMNSRSSGVGKLNFGKADIWRHNYQWSLQSINVRVPVGDPAPTPGSYDLFYPDGRHVNFGFDDQDGGYFRGPEGTADRFLPVASTNGDTGLCYLRLPDGGLIRLSMVITREQVPGGEDPPLEELTYNYTLTGLFDPNGQYTEISYPDANRMQIKEPAGRSLTGNSWRPARILCCRRISFRLASFRVAPTAESITTSRSLSVANQEWRAARPGAGVPTSSS